MPPVVAWASTTGLVLPPLEAIEIGLPNAPIAVALPLVPRLIVFAVTVPDVLVNAPVGLSVIEPVSAERLPASAIAPALTTTTLPPPVSLMPVIVSGAAVLISAMFPLVVLVALKLDTVLALFSVVPVAESAVNRFALMSPAPDSLIAPVAVRLTFPLVVNAVAMDMFSVAPPVMNVKLSVPVSALNPAVLSTVIAPLVVDSWIVCPPVTVLSV